MICRPAPRPPRPHAELGGSTATRIEQAMWPGPSTFRPNVPIAEMADYMTEHQLESSPITSSNGRLIGLLRRSDAIMAAKRHDLENANRGDVADSR